MVEAGISPMDAIRTATSRAADRLGFSYSGRLRPGARADFIVLEASPLDDIRNTRRIADVYLAGEIIDRNTLSENWTSTEGN